MTMGADPIAVATAIAAAAEGRSLRAFSVRKQEKQHGLAGRLVGPVGPGDRVVALEDTATTGGALWEAVEVLAASGTEVIQAVVLLDRSQGKLEDEASRRGIPFRSVLTPSQLGLE
jgi:orotate phosphoribosyltransferase